MRRSGSSSPMKIRNRCASSAATSGIINSGASCSGSTMPIPRAPCWTRSTRHYGEKLRMGLCASTPCSEESKSRGAKRWHRIAPRVSDGLLNPNTARSKGTADGVSVMHEWSLEPHLRRSNPPVPRPLPTVGVPTAASSRLWIPRGVHSGRLLKTASLPVFDPKVFAFYRTD